MHCVPPDMNCFPECLPICGLTHWTGKTGGMLHPQCACIRRCVLITTSNTNGNNLDKTPPPAEAAASRSAWGGHGGHGLGFNRPSAAGAHHTRASLQPSL